MRRGQKHQRREKQAQHLDNSEELSHSAVAAVLSNGEQPYGDAQPAEHASNTPALRPEEAGELIMKLPLPSLALCPESRYEKCVGPHSHDKKASCRCTGLWRRPFD